MAKTNERGGTTVFRVSDVVQVPLRGLTLRLRVVEGTPSLKQLGAGSVLRLRSPGGEERRVRVVAHTAMGGRPTQARLDKTRELDVLIAEEGSAAGSPVEIGWTATGPVRDDGR